jgi:AcrR family transcriptional regulator
LEVTVTNATVVEVDSGREDLLDAAERLFYARGFQAVAMADIRDLSALSLKRIYQLYPGKEELLVAVLQRRDNRWRGRLATYVDQFDDPHRRILAVFDWLHSWFSEPDFRGCAWINAFGELGANSPAVASVTRDHKRAFRRYLARLVADSCHPKELTAGIFLLAEGAVVTAGITGTPRAATEARAATSRLLAT